MSLVRSVSLWSANGSLMAMKYCLRPTGECSRFNVRLVYHSFGLGNIDHTGRVDETDLVSMEAKNFIVVCPWGK